MTTSKARALITTPDGVAECSYLTLLEAIWWLDAFQYKSSTPLSQVAAALVPHERRRFARTVQLPAMEVA